MNSFISLGDHEISHGEISPGHQENLLVNKFPVLAPPPNFGSHRSRGDHEISRGDHEISHGEISPGYQENLLVNKFPVFTVRKNIFMLENVQCVALEFLFNPQTLMCVTPL